MRLPVPQTECPTYAQGLVERVEPGGMDADEQIKECCFMAQLQIVYLLRPGTQEQWRRLYQEIAESRREEFEASCRHMGITQLQVSRESGIESSLLM
jgi:hypothetical protein